MKKILLLALLINCSVFQSRDFNHEPEIVVDSEFGCFYYQGRERLICNNKQIQELEDLVNKKKVDTVELKRERISDTKVFTSTKYILSSRIYIIVNREETDYSFMYNLKRNSFWMGVGSVLTLLVKAVIVAG